MLRLLIIGADGLIGEALAREAIRRGYYVTGTSRRAPAGSTQIFLDLASSSLPLHALPDAEVAFMCAAMTRFADCRSDPKTAMTVNADAAATLAEYLTSRGCRVIFLSTSAVFNGASPRIAAEGPTNGTSIYGLTKASGERAILSLKADSTVIRLTKVIGPDMAIVRTWCERMAQNLPIEAFTDHRIAPILMSHVIDALLAIAIHGSGGIYQLSGSSDISFYEMAKKIAILRGFNKARIVEVLAGSRIPMEEVAHYASLNTSRLEALTAFLAPDPNYIIEGLFGP